MKKQIIFLSILFLFLSISVLPQKNDVNKTDIKSKLEEFSNSLSEINAQIKAIDEYAPELSPDFKNLEEMNQLVDRLEFNKNKFNLLIEKYNLIEEKIFVYLEEYSKKNKDLDIILEFLSQYKKNGKNSLLKFQKKINTVALKIERLKRNISQIQLKEKTLALKTETKANYKKDIDSMTNSERIQRYKSELIKLKKELKIEKTLLAEEEQKAKKQKAKIEEKEGDISKLKADAKKAKNLIVKIIYTIKSKVINERLKGLENLKLNTIRARIYIVKTKIDTLNTKIKKNLNEQKLLEKIRKKEIKDNIIKGIIVVLIAILIAFLLIKLSELITRKILSGIQSNKHFDAHKKQRYQTLSAVVLSFTRIIIWIAAVFWTLGELEIDYGPFLVAAGGLSLAIGFGAQSLVKDIVTGFFLLIEEQFALGDFVEINGASGTVEKISLRTVRFRSLDGTVHIVPNGNISKVANSSYKWSRAVVKIGVSYNDDTNHVFKALKEVCDTVYKDTKFNKYFIEEPSIQGILAFNDSSVMFRITAKTQPGEQWAVEREINTTIKTVFDREKIEIPYNYVNVVNVK